VSVTRKNVKIIIKINFEKIVVINRGREYYGRFWKGKKRALSLPPSLARSGLVSCASQLHLRFQQFASAIESIR
jgi:hypothetical protein